MSQGAVLGTKSDGEPHFHSRGLIKMGVLAPKMAKNRFFLVFWPFFQKNAIFVKKMHFLPNVHVKMPIDFVHGGMDKK